MWDILAEELVLSASNISEKNKEALAKFLCAVARVCENGVRMGEHKPHADERTLAAKSGSAVCGRMFAALVGTKEDFVMFLKSEVGKGTAIASVLTEALTRSILASWDSGPATRKGSERIFDGLFKDVVGLLEELAPHKDSARRLVLLYCFLCVKLGKLGDAIGGLLKKSNDVDIRKAKLLKCLLSIVSGDVSGGNQESKPDESFSSANEEGAGGEAASFKIPEVRAAEEHNAWFMPNLTPLMSPSQYRDALAAIPASCADLSKNTCSFSQTGDDFTEQHWYNCHTCGLSWDKGCCGLCARICHKGHDVTYSRFSSFFCDCGEGSKTLSGSSVKCSCLNPVSTSRMKAALVRRPPASKKVAKKAAPAAVPLSSVAAKPVQSDESYYLHIDKESKKRLVERALKEGWAKQVSVSA